MMNKKGVLPIALIIGVIFLVLVFGVVGSSRLNEIPVVVWIVLGFFILIWFISGGKKR